MDILAIIEKKRCNQLLSSEEISFFVKGFVAGTIPNYQAAALLMAITINGFSNEETYFFTKEMLESGSTIPLNKVPGIKIDKHSTGGVGDKVSLILSPICAALDIKVAKLSGEGLGHTGGTIDKLKSIGINTDLTIKQAIKILETEGMFIAAQTDDIAPADKSIYSLRNATNTVMSLPLIAASIVSKKLALQTNFIFLDVKYGDGAFCPTYGQAKDLAEIMMEIFKKFDRRAVIHITNMTQPLGRSIGNAIEIKTAIDFLKGNPESDDVKELIYELVSDILVTTGKATKETACQMIDDIISSGAALEKFYSWAKAQGSKIETVKGDAYFNPKFRAEVRAEKSGYVSYLSTKEIGNIVMLLGAGRLNQEQEVDYQAGIFLYAIHNEKINSGEVIATLYADKPIDKELHSRFIENCIIKDRRFHREQIIKKVVK